MVLLRDDGRFHVYKEDSTPDQPLLAITRGLAGMAEEAGTTVAQLLRETEFLVHGQTMATNALIQRNGPVIGLLCTQGLRDIMYLGRGGKPERFNIHPQKPEDFIPRYLRLGIPERTGADGVRGPAARRRGRSRRSPATRRSRCQSSGGGLFVVHRRSRSRETHRRDRA